MYTDPDGFFSKLNECNKNNSYKAKPIIRILKHWNIQKNYRDLASYQLEKRLADELMYAYFSNTTYADYLYYSLEKIKYMTEPSGVSKAQKCISEALELEREGYPTLAEIEIEKAFPEV
jgi:hypothetical protein